MTNIGIIITVLTLIVVPANLLAQWQLSKGHLKFAYPLLVVVYSFYIVIETILALRDPSQISILLFNIVNIWALIMAYRGIQRLKNLEAVQTEQKNKEAEQEASVDLMPSSDRP